MNGGDFNTDLGLHTIHTHRQRGEITQQCSHFSPWILSQSLFLFASSSIYLCLSVCLCLHMSKITFTHAKKCIMVAETYFLSAYNILHASNTKEKAFKG